MDDLAGPLVAFLTGNFPYAMELTILGQAFSGALVVKGTRNRNGELHWFHAFVLSTIGGFAGGLFNFMWLGKPTSMISNDVVFACCVIAFTTVNFIPLNMGYKFATFLPVNILITMFAMLFRSLGMVGFVTAAFNTFQDSPSKYYPIPAFGPCWYGIMLGNMGGLFSKGVDGYLSSGIPWPFQCAIFCAPFYHFYVHDKSGVVGITLRTLFSPVQDLTPGVADEATFAKAFVSLFMQVVGILQLPIFLGPSFSPFNELHKLLTASLGGSTQPKFKTREHAISDEDDSEGDIQMTKPAPSKSKSKRKKGKKQKKS